MLTKDYRGSRTKSWCIVTLRTNVGVIGANDLAGG